MIETVKSMLLKIIWDFIIKSLDWLKLFDEKLLALKNI